METRRGRNSITRTLRFSSSSQDETLSEDVPSGADDAADMEVEAIADGMDDDMIEIEEPPAIGGGPNDENGDTSGTAPIIVDDRSGSATPYSESASDSDDYPAGGRPAPADYSRGSISVSPQYSEDAPIEPVDDEVFREETGKAKPVDLPTKTRLNITVKKLHIAAEWRWTEALNRGDDTCGICRMPFEACCIDCKVPGDDCPMVLGGCKHPFHMHCIVKWTDAQNNQRPQCPLCRQEWRFSS